MQWADTQEKIKQRQIVQQNIQHIQKQRDQLQHQVEQLTTLQSAYISLTQKISITESQIAAAQHQQKEVEDMSQKLAHDI